jgi:hypothetical protein
VFLLVLAIVDSAVMGRSLSSELANWDGRWYLKIATSGYPTHIPHVYSTLGFFPLYSMLMWLVAHVLFCSYTIAGLLISGIGGLVATLGVQRLCAKWWGEQNGQRAAVFFCLFPGSVVFSMVYSEGLLLALVVGCLIALQGRRWLLAGILAGFATAIGPDAISIVLACAVASLVELHAHSWRGREAWRSVVAPLLAPVGTVAFAVFLWIWVGTPLACYKAQKYAWHERTDLLALWHQARTLLREFSFWHAGHPPVDLNIVSGFLGMIVLAIGLVLLLRRPSQIPPAALAWTLAVSFFAVTSEFTPPNPRLLITAFPVMLVMVCCVGKRGYQRLLITGGAFLLVMSAITYVGSVLRP